MLNQAEARELNRIEERIARIVSSVHGVIDKATADRYQELQAKRVGLTLTDWLAS